MSLPADEYATLVRAGMMREGARNALVKCESEADAKHVAKYLRAHGLLAKACTGYNLDTRKPFAYVDVSENRKIISRADKGVNWAWDADGREVET